MNRSFSWPQFFLHLALLAVGLLFAAPLLWMLSTAFKSPDEIISGMGSMNWLPASATTENFTSVLQKGEEFPVWRWTGNSVFVALAATALVLVIDSFAAYSYACLRWRGRDRIFALLVATMLVPGQVLLIPTYLLIRWLGWFDTYAALVIPAGAAVFGVFLLRQFFLTIPVELQEAATLDGCGAWRVFQHVVLPLSKAPLATLGIFTFMGVWNAFEGPLILTDSLEMRTLPIGITIFQGRYNTEYGPMMAAAVLAAIPVVVAFLLFQKHITRSISLTGLAGR